MNTAPNSPPNMPSASTARVWLQAACIFAAAVVFGVIYNGDSPLGVRPGKPAATEAAPAVPILGPAGFAVPRQNEATPAAAGQQSEIRSLKWEWVKSLLESRQIVLVDARVKEEFALGHIPGAVSLPLHATEAEFKAFLAQYPRETPVVVYCASDTCHTSRELAQKLLTVGGLSTVFDMPGGFAEYTLSQTPPRQVTP
jgi:rhodanese-related sulfurtransferase